MDSIAWHPAFVEAIQLELEDYRDDLQFLEEHQLTTEPLKIDVLVIKKRPEAVIKKNIGKIFRTYNIVEYKSPTDSASVGDFHKAHGYCLFYAYLHRTAIEDMSMTLVVTRYPRELVKYLKQRYDVVEIQNGIYEIVGAPITAQIVVTKQLSGDENLWFRNLNNQLTPTELESIFKEKLLRGKHAPLHAYLNVLANANIKTLNILRKMVSRFEKYVEETGLAAIWEARGEARGKAVGKTEGKAEDVIMVLRAKFGTVPKGICESINSYSDVTSLDSLLQSAATCSSIKDFRQNLVR